MATTTANTASSTLNSDKKGRVSICVNDVSKYNLETTQEPTSGGDRTIPYKNEIAADLSTGDVIILSRDANTNKVVQLNASGDLRKKIEEYENRNLFKNAEAFVFNASNNVLYFDPDRNTVKISPERVFSSTCKYWLIRGSSTSGSVVYYTGIGSSDGSSEVASHLVNTTETYDDDGNVIGVTCSGSLLRTLTHGSIYIVEFYDADRMIVCAIPFQAYNVRDMQFDTTPENAVSDIIFGGITNNTIELERGLTWKDLALRPYLVAADNTMRDVTSEWLQSGAVDGRVVVTGLDDINSANITADGETGYKIVLKYYLSSSNISNPLVDLDEMSISHTYYVKIVAEKSDAISKVLPVIWVKGSGQSSAALYTKLYTINEDNGERYLVDVSHRLIDYMTTNSKASSSGTFIANDTDDSDVTNFKLSSSLASEATRTHIIDVPYGISNTGTYTFQTKAVYSSKYPSISEALQQSGTSNLKVAAVNLIGFATTTYGEEKMYFIRSSSYSTNAEYISALKTNHKVTIDNVTYVPNYIRVRNGMDSSKWHVIIPVSIDTRLFADSSSDGFNYTQYADGAVGYVENGTPLIVEFINRSKDSDGNYKNILCGAELFFAQASKE